MRRPMIYFFLFLLVLMIIIESLQAISGHGLVNPQSSCNIRCENGGMCAFSFENPQLHSCICLMGVYEGDRCQFQVGAPRDSSDFLRKSQYETTSSQGRSPHPEPTSSVDYRERQREMERQRDIQRRREYEQKVTAQRQEYERRIEAERRRSEMSPPVRVSSAPENREEMERINEMRRRDEELRRMAARRRQEERRREHEQRRKEEERRREFARLEEERIRNEQRMLKEQKMNKIHPKDRDIMKETTMEKIGTDSRNVDSEVADNDVTLPNLQDWDYRSDEEDITPEYPHGDNQEVSEGDLDVYGHATTVGNTKTSAEQIEAETLSGITKAIEMAADKTVMIHGIEMESTTAGPGDDDYWDHSVKAEDEEIKISENSDSNQNSDTAPAPMSDGVHLFAAEEGEEGWMMMKRVGEESSATTFALLTTITLTVIFRI